MLDDASRAWLDATLAGDQGEADRLAAVLDTATILEQQQRDTAANLPAAALAYARAGVAVFPIEPRGKRPLTRHGFKDATTNLAAVAGWWAQWPDANLGLPTGINFDVVDIDGADGIAAMYRGDQPVIDSLTVLGIALTSRAGGRHIYVPPAGIGNGTNLWPGVDYRGVGGYVVAPPSVGGNGRRYEWAQPLDLTAAVAA